jgi:hypothetical protein
LCKAQQRVDRLFFSGRKKKDLSLKGTRKSCDGLSGEVKNGGESDDIHPLSLHVMGSLQPSQNRNAKKKKERSFVQLFCQV